MRGKTNFNKKLVDRYQQQFKEWGKLHSRGGACPQTGSQRRRLVTTWMKLLGSIPGVDSVSLPRGKSSIYVDLIFDDAVILTARLSSHDYNPDRKTYQAWSFQEEDTGHIVHGLRSLEKELKQKKREMKGTTL